MIVNRPKITESGHTEDNRVVVTVHGIEEHGVSLVFDDMKAAMDFQKDMRLWLRAVEQVGT